MPGLEPAQSEESSRRPTYDSGHGLIFETQPISLSLDDKRWSSKPVWQFDNSNAEAVLTHDRAQPCQPRNGLDYCF